MIAVGVDTHKDRHFAVALDHIGQMLSELTIAATAAGYAELQRWAEQALAAGAPGSASTCSAPGTRSSRSSALAAPIGEPGNLIASTRSQRRSACSRVRTSPRHGAAGFSPRSGRC
jgi:hypothetical protein